MRTLTEIKELIVQQIDEVDLLELLGLTSQDIVNAFDDLIEERLEFILPALEIEDEV